MKPSGQDKGAVGPERALGWCSRKARWCCRHWQCHPQPCLPNQLPAKARAGRASQQGGKGAVGQSNFCYMAALCFTGRSKSPHTNLSLAASSLPPGTSIVQGTRQPSVTQGHQKQLSLPKPCEDSCSSEVPWARLCWMQAWTFLAVRALLSESRAAFLPLGSGSHRVENSVAQCRRSGSCASTSPQRDDLVGMSLNKTLEYFK